MSIWRINNPFTGPDIERLAADMQHIEDYANGLAQYLVSPGGTRRPSLAQLQADAQRALELDADQIIQAANRIKAQTEDVRDEATDLRHKFVYFDGRTEYGIKLIVGDSVVVSRSDTPYPSVTLDIPS